MRRTFKYFCELIAAVIAAVLMLAFIAVWQLAREPVRSTYLTPYVQSGLGSLFPNATAEIGSTLLVWDNAGRSVALRGDAVTLRGASNEILATFPSLKIEVSLMGLLQGRLVPAELDIEKPRIHFERTNEGRFVFKGFDAEEAEVRHEEAPEHGEVLKAQLLKVIDDLTNGGFLKEIAINDAMLTVHDAASNQDWMVTIPEMRLSRSWSGLSGRAQINLAQGNKAASLIAYYKFDGFRKQHEVSLRFSDINPAFLASGYTGILGMLGGIDLSLSGQIHGTFDNDLKPRSLSGTVDGNDGVLTFPDLWEKPRPVSALSVALAFDPVTAKFKDTKAEIDFGGTKLDIALEGSVPEDTAKGDLAFTMKIKLRNLLMDQFASIWPKVFVPGARDWIALNMTTGVFPEGSVQLTGALKWNDLGNLTLDTAEGKISVKNAKVQYIEGMPPVEGVSGEGKFDLKGMDIAVASGNIGNLRLLPSVMRMTGFDESVQNIVIPVNIAGPVREVLKLIDMPPLGYAKAAGLKQDDLDGRVEGVLEIALPLLLDVRLDDVSFKANAKLINLSAPKLIPAIELSQGMVGFVLDDEGFSVKGPSNLNNVPMQVTVQQYYSHKPDRPDFVATATGAVTAEQWTMLGVDGFTKGQGASAVAVKYVQEKGKPSLLTGDVNFKPAAFLFEPLSWTKAANVPATLSIAAEIPEGKNIKIKTIDLQGQGVKVKGTAEMDRKTGRLLSADLKPFVVGRSNAKLRFSQTAEETGMLRFAIDGEAFDVTGLRGGKEPAPTDPRPKDYSIKVGKLYTSEIGFMNNVVLHAQRDRLGWSEIALQGLADGTHPLTISLGPQLGDPRKRVFEATCDDFGKMLKGMGFTDSVHEGKITVYGQSATDNPRKIVGDVKIKSFTVSDLPVLARLMGAASPFGFADFVSGKSSFERLKGKFLWEGDAVDFQQVRAAGSVFGVNVDGHLDLNSGEANLHGTLVPFSFMNNVINFIPVVGDLITGGEGEGVLSVAYSVKGNLSDPNISVNPASLLTPGFLRNLFFGGD